MTSLRILLSTCTFIAAISAAPAFAQEASNQPANQSMAEPAAPAAPAAPASDFTITGSAGVWSQYRFRGISQSDNKPVIQGALTVTHKSGFYLSTWGSSATGNAAVDLGGTEIDVFAGYSKTIAGFTLDGGAYGYIYPGSTKAHAQLDTSGAFVGGASGISQSYFEIYGDISKTYGPVTAKAGLNWAPNQSYFKDFGTATRYNMYVFGELGFALPNFPVAFHSHLGHTAGGFDYFPVGQSHGHQYFDYTVGATYKWKSLAFDLSVVGTSLSKKDTDVFIADGEGGFDAFRQNDYRRAAKTVLVGSVSASF